MSGFKDFGRLISIEGIDATGKRTQSNLLVDYLNKNYGETVLYSFPQYSTPTGKIVADYLNGKSDNLTITERARLYADDRLAVRDKMYDQLYRGINIVCDRYVHSNVAFFSAMANMAVTDGRAQFAYPNFVKNYILDLEFSRNNLPTIDGLMVLTIPVDVSVELAKKKEKRDYTDSKADLHESDVRLLTETHRVYTSEDYIKIDDNVSSIFHLSCYDSHNKIMRTVESVSEELQSYADTLFPK